MAADVTNSVPIGDTTDTNTAVPSTHATTHKHGGSDEVATATAAANVIPKAGGAGTLAIGFIPLGSSSSTVCVGNDARLAQPSGMQVGTGTLSSGTLTISSVTLTASSRIFVTQKTAGGTTGNRLQAPSASRNTGAGTFVVNSVDTAGSVVATDTSTFDWMIMN